MKQQRKFENKKIMSIGNIGQKSIYYGLIFSSILILSFPSLASKGLQTPKVEKHLSYIESHLARMETTLKNYIISHSLVFSCKGSLTTNTTCLIPAPQKFRNNALSKRDR